MTPCLNLREFSTEDLLEELKSRKNQVSHLPVARGEPLEISIDAEELELEWCEGPLDILVIAL